MTSPISDRPSHKGHPTTEPIRPATIPTERPTSEIVNGERWSIGSVWGIVTIGRNIHSTTGQNLSDEDWSTFQRDITDLFRRLDFTSLGISTSTEHGDEDTFCAGGTFDLPTDDVRATLSALARWFFQDAISLTIGGGERIEASTDQRFGR